ncbi:Hypothetical Protein FCC1311_117942, partial [Hondaea fermentalgiana]
LRIDFDNTFAHLSLSVAELEAWDGSTAILSKAQDECIHWMLITVFRGTREATVINRSTRTRSGLLAWNALTAHFSESEMTQQVRRWREMIDLMYRIPSPKRTTTAAMADHLEEIHKAVDRLERSGVQCQHMAGLTMLDAVSAHLDDPMAEIKSIRDLSIANLGKRLLSRTENTDIFRHAALRTHMPNNTGAHHVRPALGAVPEPPSPVVMASVPSGFANTHSFRQKGKSSAPTTSLICH